MANLQRALRDIAEGDNTSVLLERPTTFLQQFVKAYCAARPECPRAAAGECPLDARRGGIGEVMLELDHIGLMLNAVNTHLGKVTLNVESSTRS